MRFQMIYNWPIHNNFSTTIFLRLVNCRDRCKEYEFLLFFQLVLVTLISYLFVGNHFRPNNYAQKTSLSLVILILQYLLWRLLLGLFDLTYRDCLRVETKLQQLHYQNHLLSQYSLGILLAFHFMFQMENIRVIFCGQSCNFCRWLFGFQRNLWFIFHQESI